jgi:hypothetical protein
VEGTAHLLIKASSLFGLLVIEKYHCVSEGGQQFWRKEMSEKEFSKICSLPVTILGSTRAALSEFMGKVQSLHRNNIVKNCKPGHRVREERLAAGSVVLESQTIQVK